jgi:small-conductance mechanosensitive channel
MRHALMSAIFVALTLLLQSGAALSATDPPASAVITPDPAASEVSPSALQDLQLRLDQIKQQVSLANNVIMMFGLQDSVQLFINDVDRLQSALLPEQKQLQAQLDVLSGPVSLGGVAVEKSDITTQRTDLTEQKKKVDFSLQTLAALRASALDLMTQIAGIRRSLLESEVTLRSGSILGLEFWQPLIHPNREDRLRLRGFIQQVSDTLAAAWQPGERLSAVLLIMLALAIWSWGRKVADRGLTWICIHRIPAGRLRRSTLALASVVATLLTAICAVQLLFYALTRQLPLSPMIQSFA